MKRPGCYTTHVLANPSAVLRHPPPSLRVPPRFVVSLLVPACPARGRGREVGAGTGLPGPVCRSAGVPEKTEEDEEEEDHRRIAPIGVPGSHAASSRWKVGVPCPTPPIDAGHGETKGLLAGRLGPDAIPTESPPAPPCGRVWLRLSDMRSGPGHLFTRTAPLQLSHPRLRCAPPGLLRFRCGWGCAPGPEYEPKPACTRP